MNGQHAKVERDLLLLVLTAIEESCGNSVELSGFRAAMTRAVMVHYLHTSKKPMKNPVHLCAK